MDRRQLLAGAAWLAGAGQANAFGVGRLGLGMGRSGALGVAKASSTPSPGTRGNRQFAIMSLPVPVFFLETNTVREFAVLTTFVEDKT